MTTSAPAQVRGIHLARLVSGGSTTPGNRWQCSGCHENPVRGRRPCRRSQPLPRVRPAETTRAALMWCVSGSCRCAQRAWPGLTRQKAAGFRRGLRPPSRCSLSHVVGLSGTVQIMSNPCGSSGRSQQAEICSPTTSYSPTVDQRCSTLPMVAAPSTSAAILSSSPTRTSRRCS